MADELVAQVEETPVVEPEEAEAPVVEAEKPVPVLTDKLYQLDLRTENAERFLTVVSTDVEAALGKAKAEFQEGEYVFEVKYLSEVLLK